MADNANIIRLDAKIVTSVLEVGECVTAVRLEYDAEIRADSVTNSAARQSFYLNSAKYSIAHVYVNNTGKKGDAAFAGRYVFIDLAPNSGSPLTYKDYVTFREAVPTRKVVGGKELFTFPRQLTEDNAPIRRKSSPISLFQATELTGRDGRVALPGSITAVDEIREVLDDFKTFTYTEDDPEKWIQYHLYIPEGHEGESLPLIVHFPSGDYRYIDYSGEFKGALFSHQDAMIWGSPEVQKKHPCFAMTIGGEFPMNKWGIITDDMDDWAAQYYLKAVRKVMAEYNIDRDRVYACSIGGGACPLWNTALRDPDLFAASITASLDFYHAYGNEKEAHEKMAKILDHMKCWWFCDETDATGFHCLSDDDPRLKGAMWRALREEAVKMGYNVNITSEDEMWNGMLRGKAADKLALDQIERAGDVNALISLFVPGSVPVNTHWSWCSVYSNEAVRDWLFDQHKKQEA